MICVGNAWLKAQPAAAAGDEPQLGIGPLNGHRCTAWGAGRSPIGVCATCSKTSACGATWRETPTLPSRLGETRYDAVISDEYRGGAPEGLALAQRMVRLAQRLDVDQGVDPILFEVPLIIYGTNSSRPPPPGVQLITNRPDEVLSKPDQQGRGDQTLTDKARIVAESLDPATTASVVARRYGLHVSQLFAWRQQLQRSASAATASGGPAFVPVLLAEDGADPAEAAGRMEIALGSVVVRVGADVDGPALRRVLEVVRGLGLP